MSNVKFRAWNNDSRNMHRYGDFHFFGDKWQHTDEWNIVDVHSGNGVIMQFTGKKDINGVEIYEGDTIRHINHKVLKWIHVSEVKQDETGRWRPFGGPFAWTNNLGKSCCGYFPSEEWEVIGNIYENPELLEEGEKK